MPTNPVEDFIPRSQKIEEPELFEILEKFSAGIEETVNFGSVIFKWCNDSLSGKADDKVPLLLLFRHSLELMDSISIQVKESSIEPCKLQLRSLFEALLGISYILEDDSVRRAYAFLTLLRYKRVKTYKKYDSSTLQGKQFKGEMKNTILSDIDLGDKFNLPEIIKQQEKLFEKEGFFEAYQEILRLKEEGRKNPNWFELYDGPRNLIELSKHLKKGHLYEVFYRYWSGYTHSTDIIAGNISKENNTTYLMAIRQPFDAQTITSNTLSLGFEIYRKVIEHFIPLNITYYRIWYKENMREFFSEVSKQNRIIKMS